MVTFLHLTLQEYLAEDQKNLLLVLRDHEIKLYNEIYFYYPLQVLHCTYETQQVPICLRAMGVLTPAAFTAEDYVIISTASW